ncbi:hypothetical protein CVT25_014480 [Psilocybe cyanescens]|uniref:Uncharacterized protein n=1 Tax=Psilocybe cyanescens TaxID=93625 RepID=A0A409XRM5_PSICY|nr:hypothetical protein CVT25_014480 [Psilocybe cyanescens]
MSLPSGIYRISQWGTFEQPQVLTATEDGVTVSPPGSVPAREQEVRYRFLTSSCIRVTDQELIVGVSPIKIHPTQLALDKFTPNLDKAWVFELLPPE